MGAGLKAAVVNSFLCFLFITECQEVPSSSLDSVSACVVEGAHPLVALCGQGMNDPK